jgi:hypothetical protein
MRKIVLGAALAAAALPGAALAAATPTPADQSNAAKTCRAERTQMGDATFRATYGTNANRSNAFGKCVSKHARLEQQAREGAPDSAARKCREEQQRDEAAFRARWGTNRNGRNAFGKCVAAQAQNHQQERRQAQLQADVNAARTCRAERAKDPVAFRNKYGTNRNKSNAFGRCVSQHARAHSA